MYCSPSETMPVCSDILLHFFVINLQDFPKYQLTNPIAFKYC